MMDKPQVISASRRTDIPAFYSEWFTRRLQAGSVLVRQPYSGKYSAVSLRPVDVAAIVFWSKNYAPLLSRLELVERATKNLFFHFTITGNRDLEPSVPAWTDAINDYRFLAKRYGIENIIWRFDPLCITDKLTSEIHEERFARCAEMLQPLAPKCIISFVHPYKKVLANMGKEGGNRIADLTEEKKKEYARRLVRRAQSYKVRLFACCNDYLLTEGIGKAACIDGHYLSRIFRTQLDTRPALTRGECACTKSADIGAYDTCAHGCVYCYATAGRERARAALLRHNPEWNALTEQVDMNDDRLYPGRQEALPMEQSAISRARNEGLYR